MIGHPAMSFQRGLEFIMPYNGSQSAEFTPAGSWGREVVGWNADELKIRTRTLGLRIIKLTEALPSSKAANVIGNQLLRCGTSVGANYRAACRARSKPDFISKVGIAIEEADESLYWIEILVEAGIMREAKVTS